jgi:hypothetical protein
MRRTGCDLANLLRNPDTDIRSHDLNGFSAVVKGEDVVDLVLSLADLQRDRKPQKSRLQPMDRDRTDYWIQGGRLLNTETTLLRQRSMLQEMSISLVGIRVVEGEKIGS